MKINRKKILNDASDVLSEMFDIMDSLCAALEYYIDNDKVANGYGSGCFTQPEETIREFLKSKNISEYIDFTADASTSSAAQWTATPWEGQK